MSRKRSRQPGSRKHRGRTSGVEWVGGRLLTPIYVAEPKPHRPELFECAPWKVAGDGRLHVETNSIERGHHLRGLIEAACGPLVRHRVTEHTDPTSATADHLSSGDPREPPSAEETGILHHPIPALDGKSPRQALRTRDGRERVETMLKEMENMEARLPGNERFDFGGVRAELGLKD